jgi:hypothetical protein
VVRLGGAIGEGSVDRSCAHAHPLEGKVSLLASDKGKVRVGEGAFPPLAGRLARAQT